MPRIQTKHFGELAADPESAIAFPRGLPGFEGERRFLALELPHCHPLLFLQSMATPELCFLALPARAVEPDYRLELAPGDLAALGLRRAPAGGAGLLCLALLTVTEGGITANLRAPVVVEPAGRRAVQSIQPEGRYSHRRPLACPEAAPCL